MIKSGTITQLSFSVVSRCGPGGSGGSTTDILLPKNVKVRANGRYTYTKKGNPTNGYASFTPTGRATTRRATGLRAVLPQRLPGVRADLRVPGVGSGATGHHCGKAEVAIFALTQNFTSITCRTRQLT